MRRLAIAIAFVLIAVTPAASSEPIPIPREGATHAVPLYGDLVAVYDAPESPYAAGHRGLDVSAEPGSPVRASAAGVVSFAGSVVGNLAVTVDHGSGLKTTYSYLSSIAVAKNDQVSQGQVVGTLGDGHDPDLPPHVHLSARQDGTYFDPIELYLGSSYSDLLSLVG